MAEEESAGTPPVPYGARDLATATALHMLILLVPLGLLEVIAWALGLLPGAALPSLAICVLAGGVPVAELYRTRPPGRRSAAAAGLATLLALVLLGDATEAWISPDTHDVGSALGGIVGLPLGAAVFAWRIKRAGRSVGA
ncbi:hypothetical protein ACFYXS_12975 [Streptomyces sp. NPDC002574]|uniref:hypothetical protein n=1 Tax=Streptomyces sp. NPDC002574 TaxID=3364652 RepID=UPI0036B6C733